jgi:hypothetical protein
MGYQLEAPTTEALVYARTRSASTLTKWPSTRDPKLRKVVSGRGNLRMPGRKQFRLSVRVLWEPQTSVRSDTCAAWPPSAHEEGWRARDERVAALSRCEPLPLIRPG